MTGLFRTSLLVMLSYIVMSVQKARKNPSIFRELMVELGGIEPPTSTMPL